MVRTKIINLNNDKSDLVAVRNFLNVSLAIEELSTAAAALTDNKIDKSQAKALLFAHSVLALRDEDGMPIVFIWEEI